MPYVWKALADQTNKFLLFISMGDGQHPLI